MINILNETIKANLILFLFFGISVFAGQSATVLDLHVNKKAKEKPDFSVSIPAKANSWIINGNGSDAEKMITDTGIDNWTSLDAIIRIYFNTRSKGELHIGLKIKSPDGSSSIKVTVGENSKVMVLSNSDYETVEVGKFNMATAGYHYIEIQGLRKSGTHIAAIKDILMGGSLAKSVAFVPSENSYFGRRGPSVHMGYKVPPSKEVQWFYNEVTVPEGQDIIGSFFMANGHAQGYFGMQVNSASERRILFSVWSPFNTNDPNQVPAEYKVTSLGNGKDVTVRDFGNEGSGKQSFKVFNWKAGTTYRFLLKGEPSINHSTDYTAYFYAPEIAQWQLIASFRRPKTSTYLKRLHSFLENFVPATGFISREVRFGNQWVYTTEGQWVELVRGTFTADATASGGHRLDYTGGNLGTQFFLKNCGFFNGNTKIGTRFSRLPSGKRPNIDFSKLKVP